jgi:TBC1 domain family member 2
MSQEELKFTSQTARREQQMVKEITAEDCDVNKLRSLIWHGVEGRSRATVWKLILGYLSTSLSRRDRTLEQKRAEYANYVIQIYDARSEHQTEKHLIDMKQIDDDIPRTQSAVPIFKTPEIQEMLRRVLYIWAIRHPSSGYVQGVNDLCSVFLCYWCLSIVVDSVLDYFFPSSSGIQRALLKIEDILTRIDQELVAHFQSEQLEMMHFSFRWLNCMFIREFPLHLLFRLWDCFLSVAEGFRVLSMYVAAALILKWKEKLKGNTFNEILMFLQNLPTDNWQERELEEVVSQAFVYFSWFNASPNHLKKAPSC